MSTKKKSEDLFTDTRVNVTERIKQGKTKFVKTLREAQKLTELRGYFYPVYDDEKVNVGFGIPR